MSVRKGVALIGTGRWAHQLAHELARLIGPFHGSHSPLVAALWEFFRMSGAGVA